MPFPSWFLVRTSCAKDKWEQFNISSSTKSSSKEQIVLQGQWTCFKIIKKQRKNPPLIIQFMLLKVQKDHSHPQEEFMTAVKQSRYKQSQECSRWPINPPREPEQNSQHFTSPFNSYPWPSWERWGENTLPHSTGKVEMVCSTATFLLPSFSTFLDRRKSERTHCSPANPWLIEARKITSSGSTPEMKQK